MLPGNGNRNRGGLTRMARRGGRTSRVGAKLDLGGVLPDPMPSGSGKNNLKKPSTNMGKIKKNIVRTRLGGMPDSLYAGTRNAYTRDVAGGRQNLALAMNRGGDASSYGGALQGGFELGAAQGKTDMEHQWRQQKFEDPFETLMKLRGSRKGYQRAADPFKPGIDWGAGLSGAGALAGGISGFFGSGAPSTDPGGVPPGRRM